MRPPPPRQSALELLWPPPRACRSDGDGSTLGAEPEILLQAPAPADEWIWSRLVEELGRVGLRPRRLAAPDAAIRFTISSEPLGGPEGYRLRVDAGGVEARAGEPVGLFRAATTLGQWLRLGVRSGADGSVAVEPLEAEDRPDLEHRGVMLDVSRNKVPTIETLEALVDRLAGWKINQLQLYTEHTFAYAGHEPVWRQASPLTAEDVRRLDESCRRRFIELVPNQNSFGHLHRWLVHPPYRPLAECPEGIPHPFSPLAEAPEPFSLCPLDPGALELLADLYDQLLPNFRSRMLNAGLDETFDLGEGRSAEACRERGRGRVYLDFLLQVHRLVSGRGRRLQFWGDIILQHPELISELPRDVLPLAWGYEADHAFAEQAERFAASGLEFYLCPGTSSWNSLAGRTRNAIENLASAGRAAGASGASGLLITDWGDFGHLQPLPVSYLGLLAGAGFAWRTATADGLLASRDPEVAPDLPIAELLDCHAFEAEPGELGEIAAQLGETYRHCGTRSRNGSPLFFLLLFAEPTLEADRYRGMSVTHLDRAREHVETQITALAGLRYPSAAWLAPAELRWVADMLHLACRLGRERLLAGRDRSLRSLERESRRSMAAELGELGERLKELWLARNRPGGLADSLLYLERVRSVLRSE